MYSGWTWGKIQRTRKTMCGTRSWVDRSKRSKWWAREWTHGYSTAPSTKISVNIRKSMVFFILNFQRILKSIICQWVVWWRRELAWFVNVTSRNNYHLKLPYLCYSFWIIDLNQLTKLADLNYTRSSSLAAIFFNLQKFLHFVISSLQLLFFFFSITLKTVYVLLQ